MRVLQRKGRSGTPWAALLIGLLATACSVPDDVNPVSIYDRIVGNADNGRLPPPGMDLPRPNLATIPPRPDRPSPEFRQAVTDALARDRANSRDPLVLRSVVVPGAPGGASPGDPPMPAAPPGRPSLAAAPAIPWSEGAPPPRRPDPAASPDAAGKAPALPEVPEEAPAAPPPELLGAPPPPPR